MQSLHAKLLGLMAGRCEHDDLQNLCHSCKALQQASTPLVFVHATWPRLRSVLKPSSRTQSHPLSSTSKSSLSSQICRLTCARATFAPRPSRLPPTKSSLSSQICRLTCNRAPFAPCPSRLPPIKSSLSSQICRFTCAKSSLCTLSQALFSRHSLSEASQYLPEAFQLPEPSDPPELPEPPKPPGLPEYPEPPGPPGPPLAGL